MEKRPFEGKVALITGAARGIGRAIAEDLAEWGANTVIVDLHQEECEKTADEIAGTYSVRCLPLACDVTKSDRVQEVAKKVKEIFGRLDFLINNAGITKDNLVLRMKEEEWDSVMAVNLKGAFLVTKAFLPLLMKAKDGGRIINISSVAALTGRTGQANYVSSKAGLIGFTKVLAREYAKKGILCNAVCPGYIETDLTFALPDSIQKELRKSIPAGRPGTPKDVSRLVRFLCSDDAGYITGNVIRVDGGAATGL